ncbi:pre-mrna-splicing factor slu7 [Gossypium arboreum]|uniref:Pre-mrna-splicing factor slu7 n=1 Tax=Gossypium arboreum TaxID=29729 RepID=A0A0B0PWB4_GOSAR|nr:pre-mrna-splicing factor slu7 [Gossypium arboreum]
MWEVPSSSHILWLKLFDRSRGGEETSLFDLRLGISWSCFYVRNDIGHVQPHGRAIDEARPCLQDMTMWRKCTERLLSLIYWQLSCKLLFCTAFGTIWSRDRDFSSLVEKAKITEEIKCAERQNCDKEGGRNKRDLEPSSSVQRLKKKAKVDRPVRAGPPVAATGQQPCVDYSRGHQGEYWRKTRACLRCGSLDHRIRECLLRDDQIQAQGTGNVQPQRVAQQPSRGRGQARGGNGMGHRQRAPSRGMFLIHDIPYTTLMDVRSIHSYIACIVFENLGILVESTTSEVKGLKLFDRYRSGEETSLFDLR